MSEPQPRFVPNIDDMLTRAQCAEWLQMTERDLADKSKGFKPMIPVFRLGRQTLRYHPRTIIAKLAKDAWLSQEMIAASFGLRCDRSPEYLDKSS